MSNAAADQPPGDAVYERRPGGESAAAPGVTVGPGKAGVPGAPAGTGQPQLPASAPSAGQEPRPWWRRLRRSGQYTPPDPDRAELALLASSGGTSLLNRSPFQIGFFVTLGGLLAYGLLGLIVALQNVVILVVLSLFLALGLNPLVEFLHARGVPRGFAVLVVALALLVLLGLGAWAVLPLLTEQVNTLALNLPAYLQGLRENPQIAEFDAQFDVINRVIAVVTSGTWIEGLFGGLLGASRAIVNVLFSLLLTLVLTLYFLASLPSIKATIFELAPASRRPRVKYLANEMFRRVGGYVTGLFIIVTCAAVAAFLFLNIIGLGAYSLALAVVVAVFAFIPLIGPTVSTLIIAIIAFSVSPTAGIATLIFFLVYQQVDAYFIQPRIFSRSVNVPGPLVVLAAVSGGLLFGIAGALIAIPTAASLLLLYREVLVPALDRR